MSERLLKVELKRVEKNLLKVEINREGLGVQLRTSLPQFFKQSPLCTVELDLTRSADSSREVAL